MEYLSKEDWELWFELPQTKQFLEAVKQEQVDMMQFLVKTVDMDSLMQARVVGIMSGLQKVLEWEYNDGTDTGSGS